jgi:hypothetical protein
VVWNLDPTNVGTGLPLEGLRVLDFSRILAGPLCADSQHSFLIETAGAGAAATSKEAERTKILFIFTTPAPADSWLRRLCNA